MPCARAYNIYHTCVLKKRLSVRGCVCASVCPAHFERVWSVCKLRTHPLQVHSTRHEALFFTHEGKLAARERAWTWTWTEKSKRKDPLYVHVHALSHSLTQKRLSGEGCSHRSTVLPRGLFFARCVTNHI